MKRSRRRERERKNGREREKGARFTETRNAGLIKECRQRIYIHVYIYINTKVSNVVNVLLYKNIVQKVIVTDKSDSQSASLVVPRYVCDSRSHARP